jgi:hypothetical protein
MGLPNQPLHPDAPPFGGLCTRSRMTLWITRSFSSRSPDAVIRVYDGAGDVIETHEHKGDFKEP